MGKLHFWGSKQGEINVKKIVYNFTILMVNE